MNRGAVLVALVSLALHPPAVGAQFTGPSTGGAGELARAERMLGHTKRVLLIAAHPDDEDTELLTYLVRHLGAEAGYLSLTRGEGGQNLIGQELAEALGLLRTEELLAARQVDGGRQFFTRAFDFGFSRSLEEALAFWPPDTLLKDVVRIVRRFRPQIVVSTFSGTPRDGHGQHQAAGWVAREAFAAAGDPRRFPELARDEGLGAWRPGKLYRSARFDTAGTSLVLEAGILDPVIGQSYRQIAMRSRSLHRSQDMGALQELGPSPIRLALLEDRTGGGPELFAGIDIGPPAESDRGPEARDLARHRATALAIRAGLVVDAFASTARLVPGSEVAVELVVWNAGDGRVAARPSLVLPRSWEARGPCLERSQELPPGGVLRCEVRVRLPADAPLSNPYFLRLPREGALYRWDGDPAHWGEPFEPGPLRARFDLATDEEAEFTLEREVSARIRDQALGEVRRRLVVVPRVDISVAPGTLLWHIDRRRPERFTVTLRHAGPDTTRGTVHLDLPAGWPPVAPQPFELTRPDDRRSVSVLVRPPTRRSPGRSSIRAYAVDDRGRRYDAGQIMVEYAHIRERAQVISSATLVTMAAVALPRARRIGYVRGAADRVPEALAGVGVGVELLDASTLERGDLRRYEVIVVGSRAYETDPALAENNARLLSYVRQGGRLVVQYQQHAFFQDGFAPYPLEARARHDRVTDETASVRVLASDHPAFLVPNRISGADWEGWVQERGLYFASQWDGRYRPLLETGDPGTEPLRGGLLVARVGRGTWIYTGLAFFRQLPAGVPGAFRLFFNLLDLESRAALP